MVSLVFLQIMSGIMILASATTGAISIFANKKLAIQLHKKLAKYQRNEFQVIPNTVKENRIQLYILGVIMLCTAVFFTIMLGKMFQ